MRPTRSDGARSESTSWTHREPHRLGQIAGWSVGMRMKMSFPGDVFSFPGPLPIQVYRIE